MSETKPRKNSHMRFALSIYMKYGEVLHVEGLTREEKDQYFDLARDTSRSLLVEDGTSIRHIMGKDIARITVKPYDNQYEKVMLPLRKMLFSESTLGRKLFTVLIKLFAGISILGIIGVFGLAMIEGNIIDVFFEPELFGETLSKGIDLMSGLFGYMVILMILLSLIDLVLGLRADYFINQDGEEPAETTRAGNLAVTFEFIIVYKVIETVLVKILEML